MYVKVTGPTKPVAGVKVKEPFKLSTSVPLAGDELDVTTGELALSLSRIPSAVVTVSVRLFATL